MEGVVWMLFEEGGDEAGELFEPMAQEVLARMLAIVQHPQAKGEGGGEGGEEAHSLSHPPSLPVCPSVAEDDLEVAPCHPSGFT